MTQAGPWLQGALALLAVFGLVALAAWAARRTGLAHHPAGAVVRPVASLAVGTRERVVVVEVGGRWLVLGIAPGLVRTLAEVAPVALPPAPQPPAFTEWLARALRRPSSP